MEIENNLKQQYMKLTGLTEGVVDGMVSGDTLTDDQKNRIKFCMPSGVAKLDARSIETVEDIIDEDIDGDNEVATGVIIVETTPTQSQDASDDEGTSDVGVGEGTDDGDGGDLDDEE